MTFILNDIFDEIKIHWPDGPKTRNLQPQCSCGWFAKFITNHYYYNGSYNCCRMVVLCGRCGEVGIELV